MKILNKYNHCVRNESFPSWECQGSQQVGRTHNGDSKHADNKLSDV